MYYTIIPATLMPLSDISRVSRVSAELPQLTAASRSSARSQRLPASCHTSRGFFVESTVRYAADAAAVHLDGTGVASSGSGSAVVSREFVPANFGAELVDGVKERSGLEVVLIRCDVDDEALDALRKRARVVTCDEPEH